jgi:hypothetical protein
LGNAIPDKEKTVKVTQLKEAILVAQLLQVLDADADEDKIDVSDIVIPEVVQEVIIEKLKRTENQAQDNIISKEQFEAIKQKNPKKLTLQQRPEVISKNKVLKHVKQQIGGSDIRFSASELKGLYLVEASLLNNFDGVAIGFSDEKSPAIQIDVKNNLVAKSISSKMSRFEWEINTKGHLSLYSNGSACTITKIAEDSYAMDVSYSCVGDLGLSRLVKPQPFSVNDLSGKSFNFKSHGSNSRAITFGNDGSVNCDSEKSSCTYENHPIHKNAVWIKGGGNKGEDNTLIMLAQGSLAKGKLLIVHFDAQYNLDSVEVMKVSGNSLNPEFESVDNDHGNDDHNHNTDDNSDSKDNSESDKQKNEIEEAKEEAKEIKDPKEDDNKDTDNLSESGTQKSTYIPFTQEMLSGKTFYGPDTSDPITFYYGANNKGQGYFGLSSDSDYVIENPSLTFDYHIDSDGFLIFTNVSISNNSSTMGLIESSDKVIKVCWDAGSSYDMNDLCLPSNLKTFYTNFLEAEDAQKELENKDNEIEEAKEEAKEIKDPKEEDNEGTDNHSDSDTQKSTYIPFTQEMLTNKYFYDTQFSQYNFSLTLLFGADQEGQASYGIYDQIDANDISFSYDIVAEGYLTLSNIQGLSDGIPTNYFIGLLDIFDHGLNVCFGITKSNLEDQCKHGEIKFLYQTADKADAEDRKQKENSDNNSGYKDNSDSGTHNPAYIPFTQEMISGKTFYAVDEDSATTFVLGANKGEAWFDLVDSNTSPDVTFDYLIDNEGYIIVSNTKEKGVVSDDTPAIGLLSKTNNAFTTCWGSHSVSDISDYCKDDDIKTWYKIKEDAETALKQREDNDKDENTDDNSDAKNSSDPGTQKPTFISFAKEMISDKTIFYVSSNGKGTYQFDPSGTGKLQYNGYHETITSPHLTFDWDISEQGNLIFSNVFYGGASISTHQIYSLSKKDTSSLEVCLFASNGSPGDERNCTEEVWFYNKEEAEGASKE